MWTPKLSASYKPIAMFGGNGNGPAEKLAIAVAVAAVFLLLVVFILKRCSRRQPFVQAASPRLRDLVGEVLAELGQTSATSAQLMRADPVYAKGLAAVHSSATALRARVLATPPTYLDVLALYSGLRGSPAVFSRTAIAVANTEAKKKNSELLGAAERLLAALEALSRAVHRLGAELDLE